MRSGMFVRQPTCLYQPLSDAPLVLLPPALSQGTLPVACEKGTHQLASSQPHDSQPGGPPGLGAAHSNTRTEALETSERRENRKLISLDSDVHVAADLQLRCGNSAGLCQTVSVLHGCLWPSTFRSFCLYDHLRLDASPSQTVHAVCNIVIR